MKEKQQLPAGIASLTQKLQERQQDIVEIVSEANRLQIEAFTTNLKHILLENTTSIKKTTREELRALRTEVENYSTKVQRKIKHITIVAITSNIIVMTIAAIALVLK